MPLVHLVRSCLIAMALAVPVAPALAQRPPEAPFIVMNDVDIDPAAYQWLSQEARDALAGANGKLKSGELKAFVFAGHPGGNYWAMRGAATGSDLFNIADLARQALQACEFYAHSSCFVVSINGKEARDSEGGLLAQPAQLTDQARRFDASRVPFLSMAEQRKVASYAAETKPKVLVITATAGWLWRTGDNVFAAAAKAYADCQSTYPDLTCILYAVNDRVVFSPDGPY